VSLQRRKPLARGKAPARSTRLAPVNRKRKAAAHTRNYGPRGDAVRAMPCEVAARSHDAGEDWQPCRGDVQAAHSTPRKMGGVGGSSPGDSRCLFPACAAHHDEAGEPRTSKRFAFIKRYRFDPVDVAVRVALELDERETSLSFAEADDLGLVDWSAEDA
jgi:hypothetical protein